MRCPSASNSMTNMASPSNDLPVCTWRGSAPACNGKCHDGEINVASDESAGGHSKVLIILDCSSLNLMFSQLAGLATKFFAVPNPRATHKWDNVVS